MMKIKLPPPQSTPVFGFPFLFQVKPASGVNIGYETSSILVSMEQSSVSVQAFVPSEPLKFLCRMSCPHHASMACSSAHNAISAGLLSSSSSEIGRKRAKPIPAFVNVELNKHMKPRNGKSQKLQNPSSAVLGHGLATNPAKQTIN